MTFPTTTPGTIDRVRSPITTVTPAGGHRGRPTQAGAPVGAGGATASGRRRVPREPHHDLQAPADQPAGWDCATADHRPHRSAGRGTASPQRPVGAPLEGHVARRSAPVDPAPACVARLTRTATLAIAQSPGVLGGEQLRPLETATTVRVHGGLSLLAALTSLPPAARRRRSARRPRRAQGRRSGRSGRTTAARRRCRAWCCPRQARSRCGRRRRRSTGSRR